MADRTATTAVIAYTSEDDRLAPVREAGERLALERDEPLILYDVDAANPLEGSPLPTAWSGDGEREQVPDRLAPADLERAGRHPIAEQVRSARARGVEAWGWLPDAGSEALGDYARRVGADVVLVPAGLRDPGLVDRLTGQTADQVAGALPERVELRVVEERGSDDA
jgi:hypothetical protein